MIIAMLVAGCFFVRHSVSLSEAKYRLNKTDIVELNEWRKSIEESTDDRFRGHVFDEFLKSLRSANKSIVIPEKFLHGNWRKIPPK